MRSAVTQEKGTGSPDQPKPLVSIFPYPSLHFERVGTPGTERGDERALRPSNDQQVWVAFDVVTEGQLETAFPLTYFQS